MIRRAHVHLARVPGESKRRPVIVLSPDRRNELANDVAVVPCTTVRRLGPWHVPLPRGAGGLKEPSVAKCEHVTTLPKYLLDEHPLGGPLSRDLLERIREAILRSLDFDE